MNKDMNDRTIWPTLEELQGRWRRLQDGMNKAGIDGALFFQNADLIYLCGTTQAEAVYLPGSGDVLVFGKPPLDRIGTEINWTVPQTLPKGQALLEALVEHTEGGLNVLALELDVLPVNYYQRLAEHSLKGPELVDCSAIVRNTRAVKTPYELDLMHQAALAMKQVYLAVPDILAQDVSELELEGRLMALARGGGHQGIIRFRGFNQEIFFGHILSGINGLVPAKVGSPTGGIGVGPGLGQGAGFRRIGRDELVSIDLCGTHGGYTVDQARLFYTGKTPPAVQSTYEALKELVASLLEDMKPGAICGDLYAKSFVLAERLGLGTGFMGSGEERCPFIGHGVGIELDEWPVLARGSKQMLVRGMTFAVEPRVFLPGIGVIGLEDTYHLTDEGPVAVTVSDSSITQVLI